jgi:hypothetical protein
MTDSATLSRLNWLRMLAGWFALMAAALFPALAAAASSVGDSYVYQLVNGYNKEVRGKLNYQVDRVDPDRITVSVSPDKADAGWAHIEIYTKEGNWLQNLVESHGTQVEYAFANAYPAYVFPLEAGKTWSVRVDATVPGDSKPRSVRVDGLVMGSERIRVPAGEFDALKVRRFVYPGDTVFSLTETRIVEFDWYVPALGRPVRTERRSGWLDLRQCGMEAGCDFRGNWDILELVETRAAKR